MMIARGGRIRATGGICYCIRYLLLITFIAVIIPRANLTAFDFAVRRATGVSVLIPVFNKCNYLPRAIDEAFSVELPVDEYEVIIGDDGSKDCSAQVVQNMQENYLNLRYFRNEVNRGTHITRLRLVQHSRMPFIAFFDADDWLVKEGFMHALMLMRRGDYDFVQYGCRACQKFNRSNLWRCWMERRPGVLSAKVFREAVGRRGVSTDVTRKILRTDVYKRGIAMLPIEAWNKSIVRAEDELQLGFYSHAMSKHVRWIDTIGYEWHMDLPDNSRSRTYMTGKISGWDERWVREVLRQLRAQFNATTGLMNFPLEFNMTEVAIVERTTPVKGEKKKKKKDEKMK